MEEFLKPGVYRHKKGKLSFVFGTAKHSETGEIEVLYVGLEDKTLHVRPLDKFFDLDKNAEGVLVPRFVFERDFGEGEIELLLGNIAENKEDFKEKQ